MVSIEKASQKDHACQKNALSLILQKIWARLKFLWQIDGQTDQWVLMSPLSQKAGDNKHKEQQKCPLFQNYRM